MSTIFERTLHIDPKYNFLEKYVKIMYRGFWTPAKYEKLINEVDAVHYRYSLPEIDKKVIEKCILAVSIVEDKIKTYWSTLALDLPQTIIGDVGALFGQSECYDDKTDILTTRGFVRFEQLASSDKVAQYNLSTGNISFVPFSNYMCRDYKGKMHLYQSKGTDLMVTPNHSIIVKHPSKHSIAKKELSSKGVWGGNYKYPRSGFISNIDTSLTNIERLLIALQADGSMFGTTPSGKERRDWTFSLKKEHKIKRLIGILDSCQIEYYSRLKKTDDGDFCIISGVLPENYNSEDIKSFGWIDLQNVNCRWAKEFFEELSKWDATKDGKNFKYYNNNNIEAIEKVICIGAISGYSINKGINRTVEQSYSQDSSGKISRIQNKDCYCLCITKNTWGVYPKRKEVDYEGKVYCLEVPSGCIVTRRNKRVVISGNCTHRRSYHSLAEALEVNTDSVEEYEALRDRIKYLTKYLESSANITGKKKILKKLVLFTSLVERCSLFTQFYILMSYAKHNKGLKTISALQETTAIEEVVHYSFGIDIINIIKKESPELWDEYLIELVTKNIIAAYKAELKLIEWFFEDGTPDHLSFEEVRNFLNDNFNTVCKDLDLDLSFIVDENMLEEKSAWFRRKVFMTTEPDFFDNAVSGYASEEEQYDLDNLDFEL